MIVALFAGVIIGIITGLTPGLHVNLVATTLLAISGTLLSYVDAASLGVFIIALSITHSFLDTIPSIYLGAPENENALSVLPGQKMLLQGKGYQAVKITILGTFLGMILAVLLLPLFIIRATYVFSAIRPYLAPLLIVLVIYMVVDKDWYWNSLLFLLSGVLGMIVFSIPIREPLFPLLSGLFGLSGLCISYFENTKIPEQTITSTIELKTKELMRALLGSSIAVVFIQFFPGLGPAQGAAVSNKIVKVQDKGYLAMIGAMGTMSVVFSLVTFYVLDKAKDGTIVVLSQLVDIDQKSFLLFITTFVAAGALSALITLRTAKIFSVLMRKIPYRKLIIAIMLFILMMSLILNGWVGVVILFTATAIGLIAPLKGIARNHAMGCLLLPVIFYFVL